MRDLEPTPFTLVFAPYYKWFIEWCYQNDVNPRDPRYLYVNNGSKILGLRDYDILLIGLAEMSDERYGLHIQAMERYYVYHGKYPKVTIAHDD